MINEDDLLTVTPLEDYETPEIPTYADNKPNLEKKLPSRWKNKAMIVAVSGLLGVTSLVVNPNSFTAQDCGEEVWLRNFAHDLCVRVHHGGLTGAPIYVAHLTEQEVFEIIKTRLEEVGFNFNAIPPSYYVESFRDVSLDLFDEEHGIGVVHISWLYSDWSPHSARGQSYSRWLVNQFAKQTNDITVGVFYTSGEGFRRISSRINAIEANLLRLVLLEDLNEQLDDFIAQLQEERIID